MDAEVRKSIGWWIVIARQQDDPFVAFFMLYMCLDAWTTSGSGEDRDDRKIDWLLHEQNPLKDNWEGIRRGVHFQSWLKGLQKIGKVEDMRPKHRGEYKTLTDINDFEQVVQFIYQIRCNLFHGGKSPVNTNDRRLVTLAGKILHKWIEWAYARSA